MMSNTKNKMLNIKKSILLFLLILFHNLFIGQVNVFIGQSKPQIKDFWATKISSVYFQDSEQEAFIIMVDNAGVPEFQALFNEKGKCVSHQTKISFKDISIIIARLKKASYKYDKNSDTWIDASRKILCKINHYGIKDYYSWDFQTVKNEKAKTIKKTTEEVEIEKEELNKIVAFAKNTFGENSTCSVTNKTGNCCGYECKESVFMINNGERDIISISTFGAICDGKEHVKIHYLKSNIRNNANSLDELFEQINTIIKNNSFDSNQKDSVKNETPAETIIRPVEQRDVFTTVQEMPEFPEGSMMMMKFIQKNIQYPSKAEEAGLSGKCFTKFIVEPNGEISEVFVLKGVPGCKECDEEAIRVIKSMPKWKPGKQGNKCVPVFINLPINFQLR